MSNVGVKSLKVAGIFEFLKAKALITNPVVISQKLIAVNCGVCLVCVSIALRKFRAAGLIKHIPSQKRVDPDAYFVKLDYKVIKKTETTVRHRCEIVLGNTDE